MGHLDNEIYRDIQPHESKRSSVSLSQEANTIVTGSADGMETIKRLTLYYNIFTFEKSMPTTLKITRPENVEPKEFAEHVLQDYIRVNELRVYNIVKKSEEYQ